MKFKLYLVFSLLSIYSLQAQQSQPQLLLQNLTDSIQKIVQAEHTTGLMLGITTRDSVLFSGGFGFADLEAKRKVDAQTLFRMGSNTKMLVALGILKLHAEGKLSIYAELQQMAAEVPIKNLWHNKHPVRVLHLLEHTSGFDDIKLNRMYALEKREMTGKAAMLLQAPSLVCRWRPGERHAYSNPNYAVLAYLIEKITNKPYYQYLNEEILVPLGMANSNFNLFSRLPNDTKEYVYRHGKTELVPSVALLNGPAGALWSNADDMLKLLQMYLRNGQPIFDEKTIVEMETPHSWLGVKEGLKSGYALGNYYSHFYNKYGFRGHNGLTGTCYSTCIYNRELGVGYVLASNSNNPSTKIEELIATFLEQNKTPQKPINQPLDQKAIAPYLGFYQFDSPRNEISKLMDKFLIANQIYVENDTLMMKNLWGEKTKLFQTASLVFRREGMNTPTIAFVKNAEDKNVLSMAGAYFEQSSYEYGLFWRGALLVMLALVLLSGVFAVGSLGRVLLKKMTWKAALPQFLPITATTFFGLAMLQLIEKQQFSYLLYKLNDINAETLFIFGGTTFFWIAGFAGVYFALQTLMHTESRWRVWFWSLAYFSLAGLAVVLWLNGLLGLRTWAM